MPATRQAFFTSEFLAQLERLSLLSRRIFRGRVKGERRSLRRGHSVEFCDYRAYGVGDDLRYVDWNIYGRLDRLHVKLFVDEEDLCLHLIVDASASMNFGSPTKLDSARRIAAALGFVGLVNLERVGVGALRDRVAEGWPPTRGRNQVPNLLDFLDRVEPSGGTSLNEGLANYAARSRQSGLAVILSDLLDPAGYESGVRALLERRFDVHLVHVLSPEEMNPELAGDLRLVDSETGEMRELSMDGDAVRAYRERLRQFLDRAETFCRTKEIGYHRIASDAPIEEFVLAQLRGRVVA
ncbi:MAG: DUF58 domain-containing protein [Candidatus Rokuibacteriota bacterium]|nr:MAG: DUF58 domain-containing protein [Candidatus Rokubacteria bacterium]